MEPAVTGRSPSAASFRKPPSDRANPPAASITTLSRAILARAAAALDGSNRPLEIAAASWPDDPLVGLVIRGAVVPTSTTAAALIPVAQQFVAALAPLSAGGELINAGIKLSSVPGNMLVPGFAPGEAEFVAELGPIPVKQFVAGGPLLSPYKLATICVLSSELIEHSDAETLARSALTESVATGLDKVLFSAAAAVPGKQPAGILNGIAALPPAAAGDSAMATDMAALLTAIAPVAGAGFMIVAAPAQAVAMMLRGVQPLPNVRFSAAVPAGTVIAIATQGFVGALETPRIDASIEAIVHMDTTPAAIVNGGAMSAPVRSLFQTNTVGLRMITPVSWGLRSPVAVAWMQNVNW